MKGIIIKSCISGEDGAVKVGIPNGIATLAVTIMYDKIVNWGAGAMTMPEGECHSWDGGRMGIGDAICLKFTDVNEPDLPASEEKLKAFMNKASKEDSFDEWQCRLQSYYKLKAYLEGIHAI